MSADIDHVVLTLQRGDRGEFRVSRATYKGSAPFTKMQLFYPADESAEAKLLPGKCVTVKDHELAQLIGVLIKIDKKQGASDRIPSGRVPQHGTVTTERSRAEIENQIAEDGRLF